MKLYNFMQDEKWYEDVGHILIGLCLPFYGWWREHRQWPPGDPHFIDHLFEDVGYRHSRVADSYRDFLGYAIGDVLRTAILAGVIFFA